MVIAILLLFSLFFFMVLFGAAELECKRSLEDIDYYVIMSYISKAEFVSGEITVISLDLYSVMPEYESNISIYMDKEKQLYYGGFYCEDKTVEFDEKRFFEVAENYNMKSRNYND